MSISPRRRRSEIVDVMRRRVLTGVGASTLRAGDRLPSARDLAAEFEVDPRLVLAAYRVLAGEGFVDIRRRSGIYVAAQPEVAGGPSVVADGWMVDVLYQGIEHAIPAPRLGEWLRRSVTTRRLRAAVVAGTSDHVEGIAGELREDYGLDTVPFSADVLDPPARIPPELASADFVVVAESYAESLRHALRTPRPRVVSATVRQDLDAEWRLLLGRGPVYSVLVDPRTTEIFGPGITAHAHNVRTLVVGRDDLQQIPPSAPVYVTRSARERLKGPVPGRLLPSARWLSPETGREVLSIVVGANIAAMQS
jgi:hypothetical protein